jgi:hypothetical protein
MRSDLILLLGLGASGCEAPPREMNRPPAVPGPVADIQGRLLRGNRTAAGVHVLARVTYGAGCNVKDSAPGGTTMMMSPTDSTGWFRTTAYPASVFEARSGCLYVGAVDTVRGETAWAAPRAAPPVQPGRGMQKVPVLEIEVPWEE